MPDAFDPAIRRLVVAAQRGDRAAFARLFERFAPMVHGVCLARRPAHEADDLVQECFLVALKRLDTLREPEAIGGWLATIARRLASQPGDVHRVSGDRAGEESSVDVPRFSDDARREAERVLGVIHGLPEAYREPLVLRLVAGLTGPEIAVVLGMTHGSVRVNLTRGMRRLKDALGLAQAEHSR